MLTVQALKVLVLRVLGHTLLLTVGSSFSTGSSTLSTSTVSPVSTASTFSASIVSAWTLSTASPNSAL